MKTNDYQSIPEERIVSPSMKTSPSEKEIEQDPYLYKAKSLYDGKYYVGYIYIDKPLCSRTKRDWYYYIIRKAYDEGDIRGGALCSERLEKIIIDRDTIEPYFE